MKFRYIIYLIFASGINYAAFGQQNYSITWQRTIGGDNSDKLSRMIQTADGGMLLCGYSNSDVSGDKKQNSKNDTYDFWLVKLDISGATQWTKTYGGNDRDLNPNVIQTSDGGYLVGGSSISDISGSKTKNTVNESFDYWVMKLDQSGNLVWDNTIGGIQFEKLAAVLETSSGYFVCGSSNSTSGYDKTAVNEGSSLWPDYWIVKLNKAGVVLWDSTYGSKNRDELTAAKVTPDGGLLLAGSSYSPRYGHKSEDFLGNNDYWIVRLDSLGRMQIDKTLGGSLSDYLTSIDLVGDAGYVLAGYSNSPASFNKTEGCRGGTDYWIIRTDRAGSVLWNKTYGGSKEDYATSVDFVGGNYFIGGYSNSPVSGDKTSATYGGKDFWTLVLDKNGDLVQQKDWGGKKDDLLVDYFKSDSGTYLLAGTSWSQKGNDKSKNTVGNTGNPDYWVFRIAPSGTFTQTKSDQPVALDSKAEFNKTRLLLDINPNPVQDMLKINYSLSSTERASISIYSNTGKLISQQVLSQLNGNYTLDLSTQSAGVYYAVLQNGASSSTKKFVKN